MKKIVALLPMKAHSARITGKNFRDFHGKPLFRWVLDTLLSIDEIDRVVINTDARDELARHGLETGGRVLLRERKASLCGDFVSMNAILEDDIDSVAADVYVMTHTTNPLLEADTIRKAIAMFDDAVSSGEGDSVFSVNRIQTRFYRADGSPVNHDPNELIRTQDLEPWFEENSNVYVFSGASFARTRSRIGLKARMLVMPRTEAVDIDDMESWALAEALYLLRSRRAAADARSET